jgi:hypothetical protein
MLDLLSIITVSSIIFIEISVLVFLYRNYITSWNVDKWRDKAEEEGFLVQLLEPVIVEVAEEVSSTIIEYFQNQLLSTQGALTRVSNNDVPPELYGVKLAEEALKGMGLKAPSAIMAIKLASQFAGLITDDSGPKEDISATPLKRGADLFASSEV